MNDISQTWRGYGFPDLEYVKKFIREYEMKEDPNIGLVDPDHVTLTNKGRNGCDDEEFGL